MVSRVDGDEVGRWGVSAATGQWDERVLQVGCTADSMFFTPLAMK